LLKKTRIAVIGALATFSLVFAALMPMTAHAASTIVLWAGTEKESTYKAWADDYSKRTGVTVKVVGKAKLQDDFKTVGDADAPDIVIEAHDNIAKFRADNKIEAVTLTNLKEFDANVISALSLGTKLYGVPLATENIALFTNTKMVPKAPKTWAELEKIALDLAKKNKSNKNFVPFAVQQGTGGDAYHMFPFLTGLGGYVFGGTPGKWNKYDIGLDNKKFLNNLSLVDKWYSSGLIKASVNGDIAKAAFTSGNAPFYVTGPWFLDDIRKSGVSYRISAIPQIIKGYSPVPYSGVQAALLTTYAAKHNVALETKAALQDLASASSQLILSGVALKAPANLKAQKSFSDKDIAAFGIAGKGSIPMPAIAENGIMWGAVGSAWVKATSGQSKAAAAFKAAAASMRDQIE
jgi:arabinogalactan oligomer / maltooligosaccharide transport system substrate-binding protein